MKLCLPAVASFLALLPLYPLADLLVGTSFLLTQLSSYVRRSILNLRSKRRASSKECMISERKSDWTQLMFNTRSITCRRQLQTLLIRYLVHPRFQPQLFRPYLREAFPLLALLLDRLWSRQYCHKLLLPLLLLIRQLFFVYKVPRLLAPMPRAWQVPWPRPMSLLLVVLLCQVESLQQ